MFGAENETRIHFYNYYKQICLIFLEWVYLSVMEQRKHKAESAIELIQNRITELVTASNGNKIFLPAAGYMIGANLDLAESYGYYWTTSIGTTNSR